MTTQRVRFRRRRGFRRDTRNLQWVRNASSVAIPASTAAVLFNITTDLDTKLDRNVNNYTVERVLGNLQLSVPASTTPGRSYHAFLGMAIVEDDAVAAGAVPEPYGDPISWLWTAGPRCFAGASVPASYASPAEPHDLTQIVLDVRSKRRIRQSNQSLVLVGYHDNGLGTNPTLYYNYSALFNVR